MRRIFALALCAISLVACTGQQPDPVQTTHGNDEHLPCDGVALDYNGPTIKESCTKKDLTGGYEATESLLQVTDTDFVLVVAYREGGFRTYFPQRSLRQIVSYTGDWGRVDNWRPQASIRGFEVAVFDHTHNPGPSCAAFARYGQTLGGRYEFEAGPGSRTVLRGYLCPNTGAGDIVGTLRDAIGKLKLPPDLPPTP
jgi:hypothetical protein